MNMISKLYFDVAPSLISQSPFAMTSAIVVLTTPSATLTLNQPICLHFGCGRLPPLDRLHTSIVHQAAVGVLLQLKQRRLPSHHPHLPLHPVCRLVLELLKHLLFKRLSLVLHSRKT